MTDVALDHSLMPEACWNTHVACLARLADSAARGLDLADVAGLTGLAFRTALTPRVTPPGQYLSWCWTPAFQQWLAVLGLDAEVAEHRADLPTYGPWLVRQHARVAETLARGFPVLYWDNLGFALILGSSGDGYLVSGVPEQIVHPLWHEQADSQAFCARLLAADGEHEARPKRIPREELTSSIEPEALFIYLHGVTRFDEKAARRASIERARRELAGRIEFPRLCGDQLGGEGPQFGTAALNRWQAELKEGMVHDFGMIQAVQSLAEARRWAAQYLARLVEWAEEPARQRLSQAAEFFKRIVEHWRPAEAAFDVPLDREQQMTELRWRICREALYQAQQTERTAARLLASVAQELGGGE